MMMVVTWTIVLLLDLCKKNVFVFFSGGGVSSVYIQFCVGYFVFKCKVKG